MGNRGNSVAHKTKGEHYDRINTVKGNKPIYTKKRRRNFCLRINKNPCACFSLSLALPLDALCLHINFAV